MAPVRLPRLAFAASALWAAWWYARAGQGAGLLAFAAVFCAACLATRRSLKPTSRAIVWTLVALAVCCLAANLARVSPGHAAGLAAKGGAPRPFWDRLGTLLFAAGLGALPFRPGRRLPAIAIASHLPLLTLALSRLAPPFDAAPPSVAVPVAGAALLLGKAQDVEIVSLGAETEKRLAVRPQLPHGAGSGEDGQLALAGELPQQRPTPGIGRENAGIGRQPPGHLRPDAQGGAEAHPPQAGQGIALALGRSENVLQARLLLHGAAQPLSQAPGGIR